MKKIIAMIFASMCLLAGEVSAAVVIYTGPIKEQTVNGVTQGVSCDALNLDIKAQSVTADIMWLDGSVLKSQTATIAPGNASYNLVTWWGATGNLYCRFTVKNKKVRGYASLYNSDGTLVVTQEAR